jgi:hypothetical protein
MSTGSTDNTVVTGESARLYSERGLASAGAPYQAISRSGRGILSKSRRKM